MNNLDTPAEPTPKEILDELTHQCITESTGLTKREQACITLLVPESGDEELDELIRKSRRQKISTNILAGLMTSAHGKSFDSSGKNGNNNAYCAVSIGIANELIKQLESE